MSKTPLWKKEGERGEAGDYLPPMTPCVIPSSGVPAESWAQPTKQQLSSWSEMQIKKIIFCIRPVWYLLFFLSAQNIILIFECVFFNSHFCLETNVCNSASHHNFDMCVCIMILIISLINPILTSVSVCVCPIWKDWCDRVNQRG